MPLKLQWLAVLVATGAVSPPLRAQVGFSISGHPVQIHGFLSQGFAYSDQNNYLTMQTSRGTFAMTDLGLNASLELSDRLRVGIQGYARNIGHLGDWHPQVDWAVADYRFRDWLGIRGGIVKTTFGLEGDTQDMEFLRPFVLLPQSVYPTDLREALLRHRGGDLYGEIPLRRAGSLAYTVFAGIRSDGRYGGYPYLESAYGVRFDHFGGLQVGQDLRWKTPLRGLLVGASRAGVELSGHGTWTSAHPGQPPVTIAYEEHSRRNWTHQFYGEYTAGNLRLASEYRRYWFNQMFLSDLAEISTDVRGWYVSAGYRLSRRLELGAYYSRWTVAWATTLGITQPASSDAPGRHLYDKVVAARVNLTRHWHFKLEGHFIDGYGCTNVYPSGFYFQDNPQGLQPATNLLLLRTGWDF